MASSIKKIFTINNLAPGASTTKSWQKPNPPLAVWYIQAIPLASSFSQGQFGSVEVEVTRVWRKLNRTLGADDEHEIWYKIKNVGTEEVDADVYASSIS
jgi:hypothetical protein